MRRLKLFYGKCCMGIIVWVGWVGGVIFGCVWGGERSDRKRNIIQSKRKS